MNEMKRSLHVAMAAFLSVMLILTGHAIAAGKWQGKVKEKEYKKEEYYKPDRSTVLEITCVPEKNFYEITMHTIFKHWLEREIKKNPKYAVLRNRLSAIYLNGAFVDKAPFTNECSLSNKFKAKIDLDLSKPVVSNVIETRWPGHEQYDATLLSSYITFTIYSSGKIYGNDKKLFELLRYDIFQRVTFDGSQLTECHYSEKDCQSYSLDELNKQPVFLNKFTSTSVD